MDLVGDKVECSLSPYFFFPYRIADKNKGLQSPSKQNMTHLTGVCCLLGIEKKNVLIYIFFFLASEECLKIKDFGEKMIMPLTFIVLINKDRHSYLFAKAIFEGVYMEKKLLAYQISKNIAKTASSILQCKKLTYTL